MHEEGSIMVLLYDPNSCDLLQARWTQEQLDMLWENCHRTACGHLVFKPKQ